MFRDPPRGSAKRRQRRQLLAVGYLLVLTGVVTTVLGVVGLLETRWVVDPLRYEAVEYLRGYHGISSIHLISGEGRYRLPPRLWPEGVSGTELAARLREEDTAVVRVVGGDSQFWFGYPVIEYFETATLILEAPPVGRSRALILLVVGPFLAAGGIRLVQTIGRITTASA